MRLQTLVSRRWTSKRKRGEEKGSALMDCGLCSREFPVVLGQAVDMGDSIALLCPLCIGALDLKPDVEWVTLFRSGEADDGRDLDAPDPADIPTVCAVCSKPCSALTDIGQGSPEMACQERDDRGRVTGSHTEPSGRKQRERARKVASVPEERFTVAALSASCASGRLDGRLPGRSPHAGTRLARAR